MKKKRVRLYSIDDLIQDVVKASFEEMRTNNKALKEYYVDSPEELDRLRKEMRLKPMDVVWKISDPTQYPERFTLHGVTIKARQVLPFRRK